MTLRVRIAAVASLAVALAVVVAAVSLYLAVRSDLRGQIDQSLSQRAQIFVPAGTAGPPDESAPGFRAGRPPQGGRAPEGFPKAIQPARFGGATGYVQFISPQGQDRRSRRAGLVADDPAERERSKRSRRAAAGAR